MLPVNPFAVDTRGHIPAKSETVIQSRSVRSRDKDGQANVDGTKLVRVSLNVSNWMIEDEMMCKPEMQPKYANITSIINGEGAALVCCHNVLIAAPIPFQAPHMSCIAVSFCRLAMAADIASRCIIKTRTAVYIFRIPLSGQYMWSKFTQTYRVKCLEKNLQGNCSTSVVDRDRKPVFRMSEKHRGEGTMNDDKERMESVAPVAESMVASGWEGWFSVEECCGERAISVAAAGMRRRRSRS